MALGCQDIWVSPGAAFQGLPCTQDLRGTEDALCMGLYPGRKEILLLTRREFLGAPHPQTQ